MTTDIEDADTAEPPLRMGTMVNRSPPMLICIRPCTLLLLLPALPLKSGDGEDCALLADVAALLLRVRLEEGGGGGAAADDARWP